MVEYIKAIVTINIVKFKQEVVDSSIVPVMDSAVHNSADNSLYIYFNISLSAGEETTLDGLITAHDPTVDPGTVGDVNITPDDSGSVVIDGLRWPQADGAANYVLDTDGAGQLAWIDLPSVSVYGSEYEYDESLATSSTTSLTYVQKLRLTTASLVGGDYRLSWAGAMLTNAGAISGKYRIQIDNTNTIHEVEVHIKDHNEGNTEVGGFRTLTLAAGVHTIDLDYEAIIANGVVEIKKVVIDLLRVA